MIDDVFNYLLEDKYSERAREKKRKTIDDNIERAMRQRIRKIPKRKLLSSKIRHQADTTHELTLALRSIKKVQSQISTLRKLKSSLGIAGFLLASGSLVYHKYLEKAARECKKESNKKKCMDEYRMKARKNQLSLLTSKKSKCSQTDRPKICKKKIDEKIKSLKKQIKDAKKRK